MTTTSNEYTTAYFYLGLVMFIVVAVGVTSNTITTWVFKRIYWKNSGSTNLLILSLSVCNLSQNLLTYPLNVIACSQHGWFLGEHACLADAFFVHWMAITSIAHLVALSVDRYFSVFSRKWYKASYVWYIVACCWLYGFTWSLMPLVGWSHYTLEGLNISCSVSFKSQDINSKSYSIVLMLTNFVLPFGLIAIFYSLIYRGIRLQNKIMTNARADKVKSEVSKAVEKKLCIAVFIMVIAFTIAWTPYAIVCLMTMINGTTFSPLLHSVAAFIAKSSTCYYPFIFGMKHANVREELRKIFGFRDRGAVQTPMERNTFREKPITSIHT